MLSERQHNHEIFLKFYFHLINFFTQFVESRPITISHWVSREEECLVKYFVDQPTSATFIWTASFLQTQNDQNQYAHTTDVKGLRNKTARASNLSDWINKRWLEFDFFLSLRLNNILLQHTKIFLATKKFLISFPASSNTSTRENWIQFKSCVRIHWLSRRMVQLNLKSILHHWAFELCIMHCVAFSRLFVGKIQNC